MNYVQGEAMAGIVEKRRSALRDRLIEIAEATITADGLGALRARDLAAQAGCAVGAIYNVFGDLTDLVLAVNARTFEALGAAVSEALAEAPADPVEQLVAMSGAYHRFAAANHNGWQALFDVDRPAGQDAPDWYLSEMARLLAYIDTPLAVIFPAMGAQDRALMTRALFSSVHGIVLLGLDRASSGVPAEQIDHMIGLLLRQLTEKQSVS
jgi:AcrR family transcriptional regulator